MATLRTPLRLALLLALMALTSGLGGACAPTAAPGSCLCMVEDAAANADVSGGEVAWAAPAKIAAPESTARSAPAVLAGAAVERAGGDPPSPSARPRPSGTAAGLAPLYLSHCAFLC